MSSFSRMTPLRRAAMVAAPLAVAAVALSACSPTHVTEINSPTPAGSSLATPYTPQASEPAASATASATASADAASFFSASTATKYTVESITVGGATVDPGVFTAVSMFGDAADGSATLTTIGLCDGSVYSLDGKGATVTSTAGETWSTDKCGDPAGEAVATQVHSILEGKVTATSADGTITLKGGKGSLALTAAN
ncbi:MAG: hypothetical protein LBE25_01570 [Arthrobacter sp.]|nr:hypothetical protein [Arthrobacter sp.]